MDRILSTMDRVPSWTDPIKMDRTKAFYDPLSGDYQPSWRCDLYGEQVPKISDALAGKTLIRHPVRPQDHIDMNQYTLMHEKKRQDEAKLAEPVLSAHVCPRKFGVDATRIKYPASAKYGAGNPLYATAAAVIGKEPPLQHQLPERYFPKNCDYSKSFTDSRPRFTGLMTRPTPSKVHSELDNFY